MCALSHASRTVVLFNNVVCNIGIDVTREREKRCARPKSMLKVCTLVVLYLLKLIVIYLFNSKGCYSGLNNQLLIIKKRA